MRARRVIAGVSGSPGSLQALRYAAGLARTDDSVLAPVLAWTPPGGELADRRAPCPQLRTAWKQAAWERLWQAIGLAIGGPPADLEFAPSIVRGPAGLVLSDLASEPGDVLVIGAGRRGALRMTACKVSKYCLGHARCPVIAVPPPELAAELHGFHGWMHRHRMQPEDADLHATDV
ncbi:MAG TPA: universal stress protein [Streptosporangiaceae bacterium]|nr:universal stress protein [Streptosporangiaceae bacterium]